MVAAAQEKAWWIKGFRKYGPAPGEIGSTNYN
jgi:hypothetical protein